MGVGGAAPVEWLWCRAKQAGRRHNRGHCSTEAEGSRQAVPRCRHMGDVGRTPTVSEEVQNTRGRLSSLLGCSGLVFLAVAISVFALFLIHQLTVWLSLHPEDAFHNAKVIAQTYASIWNTVRVLWNEVVAVVNILLSAWNVATVHFVQPLIFGFFDIMSLVFLQKHYEGVIRDASGFQGHACSGDLASAAWCGSSEQYIQKLHMVKTQGADVLSNGSQLLISTVAARRLSEMINPEDFSGQPLVGELDLEPMTTSLDDFTGSAVIVTSQVADVGAHVIYSARRQGPGTVHHNQRRGALRRAVGWCGSTEGVHEGGSHGHRIVLGGGGGCQGAPKNAGAPGARPSRPGAASRYSPRPSRMALAGARSSAGRLSEWTMARIRFRPASVPQNARTASWTAKSHWPIS